MKEKKQKKVTPQPAEQTIQWNKIAPWAVFVFAFLLYSNTLNHFYAIDDNIVIYSNKLVLQGYKNLPELLTKPYYYGSTGTEGDNQIYRPLSLLSFATDIELFGKNPFMFHHFMNVLLFALSSLFLFLLLKRLLKDQHILLPFIIALLYAAHPIHTDVVANIKSRDEILGFLFGLILALYTLFKYLDTNQKKYFVFSFIAYFIGIFAKENAITFLAVIPLTLYFFSDIRFKKIFILTMPYVAIAIIFLVVRHVCISSLPQPDMCKLQVKIIPSY